MLAWLLLTAQLFSQLHAIEHLGDAEHDTHKEEICLVCILNAGLDAGDVAELGLSSVQFASPRLAQDCCKSFNPVRLAPYQGRAPPSLSSLA